MRKYYLKVTKSIKLWKKNLLKEMKWLLSLDSEMQLHSLTNCYCSATDSYAYNIQLTSCTEILLSNKILKNYKLPSQ